MNYQALAVPKSDPPEGPGLIFGEQTKYIHFRFSCLEPQIVFDVIEANWVIMQLLLELQQ